MENGCFGEKKNEVDESMEEGNIVERNTGNSFFVQKKKKRERDLCGNIFIQMLKWEHEPHSYSDEDNSR